MSEEPLLYQCRVEVDGEKVSLQVHDTAGQGDLDM